MSNNDSNSDTPRMSLSRRRRLLTYLRKNWLPVFSAFVLGLGFPLWKMFIYEVADISVEVTEVEKTSDSIQIDLTRDPAFKPLFEGRSLPISVLDLEAGVPSSRVVDLTQLERLIEGRKDAIEREESRLPEQRKAIDDLKSLNRLDLPTALKLNMPLVNEVDFDPSIFRENKTADIEQLRMKFIARLSQDLEQREKGVSERKKAFETARIALQQRQQQASLKLSKIAIKCAISNSGAGAISLRPQAFLRVYLGGNNYVDVELNMEQYDSKGDMQPKSSRIVTYKSDQLEKFRESDQDKINTYFKQNVPAALFIVDINGKVYQSNTIPFAQGLYQQSVFDRLRSEASKRKPPDIK